MGGIASDKSPVTTIIVRSHAGVMAVPKFSAMHRQVATKATATLGI